MGYLAGEVADLKLLKDELEELTNFITKSGKVSKPITYLYLEGKGKEKMTKEEVEKKYRRRLEKKRK